MESEIASSARAADAARRADEARARADEERRKADAAQVGAKVAAALPRDPARLQPTIAFADARGQLPMPAAGRVLKAFGAADGFGLFACCLFLGIAFCFFRLGNGFYFCFFCLSACLFGFFCGISLGLFCILARLFSLFFHLFIGFFSFFRRFTLGFFCVLASFLGFFRRVTLCLFRILTCLLGISAGFFGGLFCILARFFTFLALLVLCFALFTLNLYFSHMLLADTGAAPSMDYFGSGKYLIKTFDKRNNLAEIKRSVVKSNTKRHNLTNGYFLFARFIYNDYGLILNGTDRYGTNLRRNNFKQAGFTALRTVNRADI